MTLGRSRRLVDRLATLQWLAAGLVALLMLQVSADAAPSTDQASEFEVKAAYLFNFARFVKWPAQKLSDSSSPFLIGVVGDDSFSAAIDSVVRDKVLFDRKVAVRRVSSGEDLRRCHLVFVSRTADARSAAIVAALRDEPVLTVGESDKFISGGGMINFITVGDTIRFEINPAAAQRSGLKVDSRLLSLARIADAGRPREEN